YETAKIPLEPLPERIRHVVQSCFDGRRIVIFSGGAREDDATLFDEVEASRAGGGFGSIIGRNSFQRPREDAIKMLTRIIEIYAG
ncbi:MAG: class I fructose-bisphosphate aldolase, partial [Candidatus Binataceae bacterium]